MQSSSAIFFFLTSFSCQTLRDDHFAIKKLIIKLLLSPLFQGYDLLMTALRDPKEKVHRATLHVFLPALGMWSRELGRLEHHLMHNLLKHLEDTVKAIPYLLWLWRITIQLF